MVTEFGDLTLFDVDDISERLGMTKVTIRQKFRSGELKGRKLGRKWFATEENLRDYFSGPGENGDDRAE